MPAASIRVQCTASGSDHFKKGYINSLLDDGSIVDELGHEWSVVGNTVDDLNRALGGRSWGALFKEVATE